MRNGESKSQDHEESERWSDRMRKGECSVDCWGKGEKVKNILFKK